MKRTQKSIKREKKEQPYLKNLQNKCRCTGESREKSEQNLNEMCVSMVRMGADKSARKKTREKFLKVL
jgi:hypothetical protein